MATLAQVLNVVIPIAIILFFVLLIYGKVKAQADALIGWFFGLLRRLFEGSKEEIKAKVIVYE